MYDDININETQDVKDKVPDVPFKGINRIRLFILIVLGALSTIFYVNNVMQINSLLKENQSLKKNYKNFKNGNELLRARLNELESAERIIGIATNELGMVKAAKPPEIIEAK